MKCFSYKYTEICSTTEGVSVMFNAVRFISEATEVVTLLICCGSSFIQISAISSTPLTDVFHSFPHCFQTRGGFSI